MLFSTSVVPSLAVHNSIVPPRPTVVEDWPRAMQRNRGLIAAVVGLIALAIIVTVAAAPIELPTAATTPAPTPTVTTR